MRAKCFFRVWQIFAGAVVLAAVLAVAGVAGTSAQGSEGSTRQKEGVAKNGREEPLNLLAEQSRIGDAAATFEIARRLEFGIGIAADPEEAAHWYLKAEEQGFELPDDTVERLFP